MGRLLTWLMMLLLLLCGMGNHASAKALYPENIASGGFGGFTVECTGGNCIQLIEKQWDELEFRQQIASDVLHGPNVYTYVNQNPWTSFDPLGLATTTTDDDLSDNEEGSFSVADGQLPEFKSLSPREKEAERWGGNTQADADFESARQEARNREAELIRQIDTDELNLAAHGMLMGGREWAALADSGRFSSEVTRKFWARSNGASAAAMNYDLLSQTTQGGFAILQPETAFFKAAGALGLAIKGFKYADDVARAAKTTANANRIMGARAVDDFIAHAQTNGMEVVGREVTFRTPFGNRRLDVVLRNLETGQVGGVEIKSTMGAFNRFDRAARQQFSADRWINTHGADAVGQFEGLRIDNTLKMLWEAPK